MRPTIAALALALTAAHLAWQPAAAASPPADAYRSMDELLAQSGDADWRTPDPDNLLYLELDAGRVIIELAPAFAPAHVDNLRTLAREGYWDGLALYRSQDNFVVQWGDPAAGEDRQRPLGSASATLPAEFDRDAAGLSFHRLPDADGWAPEAGFVDGFPAARDPASGRAWLAHCYGMVGAGRDAAPDSSNGTELYAVIGQAPRQLDRNITLVGRVLQGMELLSTMPRGDGPLGMYREPAMHQPIHSVKLASQLPAQARVPLRVLRTDTPLFDAVVESRRNRRDGWYLRPAGHIDLCNAPLPVRVDAGR